jgi:hypothetical protein
MEFEGIFGVTMGCVLVEVAGDVDDCNGFKRAFLKKNKISRVHEFA